MSATAFLPRCLPCLHGVSACWWAGVALFFLMVAGVGAQPTVVSLSPAPGSTVTSLGEVTAVFSEPVTGVVVDDLLLNGRSADSFEGSGVVWTFRFSPPPFGDVELGWDAGSSIVNAAGERFVPGPVWHVQFVDSVPPRVVRTTPSDGTHVRELGSLEVEWSEEVQGVTASALRVSGMPAASVEQKSGSRFKFHFPKAPDGLVVLEWVGGASVTDGAGNQAVGFRLGVTVDPGVVTPSVRITEFLASNVSGLKDENKTEQDWIELRNEGGTVVDLAGWTLTDNAGDVGQWSFPSTNLAPRAVLVVFASAKDRRQAGASLHTNFKLRPTGGYLGLFQNGVWVSGFDDYPEQRNNVSYGIDPTGAERYFASPTPGGVNAASDVSGVLAVPHVNIPRGFFDQPIRLVLSSPDPGAEIRFTTDGKDPTAVSGQVYVAPVWVTNTTSLRMASFRQGQLPSQTVTHTYVFLESVLAQGNRPPGYPVGSTVWGGNPSDFEMDPEIVTNAVYGPLMRDALKSLPSIFLTIPVEDMFGATRGLYTHTEDRGPAWERLCSVEMVLTNGVSAFQVNCGVQIQGNANRTPAKNPKHAMRLTFKGEYGPTRLHYRVFPDSPVQEFDTLILRSDFNFGWLHWSGTQRLRGQRTRDAFMKDSLRAMGSLASHNRYCHLYINGMYWGVYDPAERPDGAFAASYLGGQKEDYDVVNEGELVDGTMAAYNKMLSLTTLQREDRYREMLTYLDMPQFIDYMLLHFFVGHQDWGNNKNWYTLRPRDGSSGFKYVAWDGENTLDTDTNYNRIADGDVPSGLHVKLTASAEYRLSFADRVHRHMFHGGALTPTALTNRWLNRAKQVELAIVAESARWGDYRRDVHAYQDPPYELYTRDNQWKKEQERLVKTYFPNRGAVVLKNLQASGLYPRIVAPDCVPWGGLVRVTDPIQLNAPTGEIYFTWDGTDPRIPFSNPVSSTALLYREPFTLSNSVVLKARTLVGTNWSALMETSFQIGQPGFPLRFSEIHYHPPVSESLEFVELRHLGAVPLDASGFSFEGISFVFPPGSRIQPGQILVLAPEGNPSQWTNRHPEVKVFGWYGGSLANGGERLVLRDAALRVVHQVTYGDGQGWPAAADGAGSSLEMVDPLGNADDPAQWRASVTPEGTPGLPATEPALNIRFSELQAVPHANAGVGSNRAFVEIWNPTPSARQLGGWALMDVLRNLEWVVPGGTTLESGARMVLWLDSGISEKGWATGLGDMSGGGRLVLRDAASNRVDAISWGMQAPGYSLSREGGDWRLSEPTPGREAVWIQGAGEESLWINEWLANSRSGESDWIELLNRSVDAPLLLRGYSLETPGATVRCEWLNVLGPRAFLRMDADEDSGPLHLGLRLPSSQGSIILRGSGGDVLQEVVYPTAVEGVSQGYLPDGDATGGVQHFTGSSSPGAPNARAPQRLRFSEFMASNQNFALPGIPGFPDWMELESLQDTALSLKGYRIRRLGHKDEIWTFPDDAVMAPRAFRMVICGEPGVAIPNHVWNAGFPLYRQWDRLQLMDDRGVVVDEVEFGQQLDDHSVARVGPDGNWKLAAQPTPGMLNSTAALLGSPAALRLNEWTTEAVSGVTQLELINLGDLPVETADVYVSDDLSIYGKQRYRLSALSFLPPHGYLVLTSERGFVDPNEVGLVLDGTGNAIQLWSPEIGLVDQVFFGATVLGEDGQARSFGKVPDGHGVVTYLDTVSLGTTNQSSLRLVEPPLSRRVAEGAGTAMEVVATSSFGPVTYQWWMNGNILPGAQGSRLLFDSVTQVQQGVYRVEVRDSRQALLSPNAILTVLTPVRLVSQPPAVVNVVTGATLRLTTFMLGSTPITYRWFRNNVEITNGVSEDASVELVIPNVRTAQAGRYVCQLLNEAMATPLLSRTSVVNVLIPPAITVHPVSVNSDVGSNVTFSVTATGSNLEYQWRRNGEALPLATNKTLTLNPLVAGHAGQYSVRVSNAVGSTQSVSATLGLRSVPLLVIEKVIGGVRVSWSAVVGTRYAIETTADLEPPSWQVTGNPVVATTGRASVTLEMLGTGAARYFRVVAMP